MSDKHKLRDELNQVYSTIYPYLGKFENTWPDLESHLGDICHYAEKAIEEIEDEDTEKAA